MCLPTQLHLDEESAIRRSGTRTTVQISERRKGFTPQLNRRRRQIAPVLLPQLILARVARDNDQSNERP